VVTLAFVGLGLAVGVFPGHPSVALELVPVAVSIGAVALTLGLGRLSRKIAAKSAADTGSRLAPIAPALEATADGVQEALRLLRKRDPWLLIGIAGYMVFDILVLWASFRAIGVAPELALVWMAYVIGQLGNLIPLPAGIGGVELGLVGMLVLYGFKAVPATAAVLIYRAVQLWVPAVLGGVAFVQLRALLRREAESIELCKPGQVVEIIGAGPVIPKPPRM
ncbi:MAG TPA: lysylphosphatidylglycerol synthase transmembrane domain-containing protein, partial [Solirubrobacteraceae bacterium]|nr:lysylphosphatidylglycerol synthase transmembrane domain-containing protein [Solirubrobacteraceae bacterium]